MENYEQKYKEAIKRLKKAFTSVNGCEISGLSRSCVEQIFPELRESDDDRIRKGLIKGLSAMRDIHKHQTFSDDAINIDDAISWLENQANIPHFTYDDILALQCAMKTAEKADNELYEQLTSLHDRLHDAYRLEKQGESIKIKKGKNYLCTKTHKYAGVEWIEGVKYYSPEDYSLVNQGCTCYCPKYSREEHNNFFKEVEYDGCSEKQGEQNPADKVEPKFKIGDTIKYIGEREEFSKEKHTIKKILDDCYLTIDDVYIPFKFENYYILVNQNQSWSEEDEKILKRIDNLLYSQCQIHGSEYESIHNWLKSIKPNHWKPSEYDISLLEEIARNIRNNVRPFCSEVAALEDLIKNIKTL